MHGQEEKHKKIREEIQEELRLSMEKEISVLRELLSNMHQEEHILLANDKDAWNRVMQERAHMIEQLRSFRLARMGTTKKLEELAISLSKKFTFEDMDNCEIASMRDQIMALLERLTRQSCHNQLLFDQFEHRGIPRSALQQGAPLPEKKTKTSIATYPRAS